MAQDRNIKPSNIVAWHFSKKFDTSNVANVWNVPSDSIRLSDAIQVTSTGIDADASKGKTSPGYFNSKLVYSCKCGTFFPWEFPEISPAHSHIFLKGPSRSIIYGKIFWPPHPPSPYSKPGPHLPSKSTILCFSVFLSFNYSFWEYRQYL